MNTVTQQLVSNKVETVKLRSGVNVYATQTKKYGLQAKSYANNLQAETQQLILSAMGIKCHVIGYGNPCKYIVIL